MGRYSGEFIAEVLTALEAEGYPGRNGALTKVAKRMGVPESTIRGWHKSLDDPLVREYREVKKGELSALILAESVKLLEAMGDKRGNASLRDLVIAFGILIDKLQVLQGHPTEITKHQYDDDDTAEREVSRRLYRLASTSGAESNIGATNQNGKGTFAS